MFGFTGADRIEALTRKRGYMAEAQARWPFLTYFDASTIKNERQLVSRQTARGSRSIPTAPRSSSRSSISRATPHSSSRTSGTADSRSGRPMAGGSSTGPMSGAIPEIFTGRPPTGAARPSVSRRAPSSSCPMGSRAPRSSMRSSIRRRTTISGRSVSTTGRRMC